jgi:pyruvate dehydrogenase E1 component alpha subunit
MGGSMHVADFSKGIIGANGIVGGGIGLTVGAALAAQLDGRGAVAVAFFGDGASNQGVLMEALNVGALWKLPLILVCENNGYAVHSALSARQAYRIGELTRTYGIPVDEVDAGHDPRAVRDATAAAVERIRAGGGPEFLEIRTCRFREHVGTGEDFQAGYRSETDVRAWAARDPLTVDAARVARLTPGILAEIEAAMAFAEDSPWPGREELLTDVL